MAHLKLHQIGAVLAAILYLVVCFYFPAAAEVPSNDDLSSPLEITSLPFEGTYDTSDATVYYDPNPTCNYSTIEATVWFRYTPAISTQVDLTAIGSYTTIVGVYREDTDYEVSLTQVACGINPNPMTIALNAGTSYLIQVGAVGAGAYPPPGGYGGTLYLSLRQELLPANDNFTDATVITSLPYSDAPVSPYLATLEPDEPLPGCTSGADPGDTLWYAIAPAESNDFVLNLDSDQGVFAAIYTSFSNEARIFETCAAGLNMLTLDAGITYYVQIGTLWQEQDWWVTYSLDILRNPVVSFEYKQLRGYELPTVYFNNTSYDPAGFSCWESISWDFGDGATSGEWNPTHTYASAGDYLVTLSLTTCDGRSGSAQQWITALVLTDIIYVDADATGANNGISWADAYTELEPALDEATAGIKIWVAEGTYKPTVAHGGTGERFKSFQMKNGVAIYGGFAGTETILEERDWLNHVTTLSGDLGVEGANSDNSYHVFYHPEGTNLDSSAVMDGVTITNGNSDGYDLHWSGGGMYNHGSSPTLINCIFINNRAYYFGGGIFNGNIASLTLTNCSFANNSAYYGGGIYNSSSSPKLTNSSFSNNSAYYGGGMYNAYASSPSIVNTIFSGNSAHSGGGMQNDSGATPMLLASIFKDNSATDGGAIYNNNSSPVLNDCVITGNSAYYRGGGVSNEYYSSPTISNCTFEKNQAQWGGGLHNFYFSSPKVINSTFVNNTATSNGGGIYNDGWSSPSLINSTIVGNTASWGGGGMYNSASTPVLTNAILWENTPDQISNWGSTPAVTYSDVQGGYVGEGNIDADPRFVDAANGDFHLSLASPAIDAGNNAAPNLPELDFEGDPRILDGNYDGVATTDMGVDEVVAPPLVVFYVDADASGANDGSSWADAFTELQPALEAAQAGNQIWVAEGIYQPTVEHGGSGNHYLSFQMKNGVAIYGGFDGTESYLHERNWINNVTVLSGDLKGNDKPNFVKNDENSYHVFYHPAELALDDSAILDGFIITGGNASDNWPHNLGGGMLNMGASPTLVNVTFTNNAALDGGGMYNSDGSSPSLANCLFSDNLAERQGGAVANLNSSSPTLNDCTISGNTAKSSAGGMFNYESNPVLSGCTFSNNAGESYGGGMLNVQSSPVLMNCIFSKNSAANNGGGLYNNTSNPVLTNCTFSGNKASSGGAIFNFDSSPVVTNSILWGDTPNEMDSPSGVPVITYSDIQGGYAGEGNIDADPRFVDPANGDYHLKPRSMCIDAGNNTAPNLPETDFEGDVRILDGNFDGTATVDMGVDEAYFATQPAPVTIYVDLKANGADDGTSWKDAYLHLHPALATALPGDQVWVAKGTYKPTKQYILGDPRSASFQLRNGVAVYGGFSGTESSLEFRDWVAYETILSGDLNGDDGPDFANYGDNSYHVFYHPAGLSLNGSAILDGFTIRGGNTSGESPTNLGGGMFNDGSSPTIQNCIFEENRANYGGGIYNDRSSPIITNCTFMSNSAFRGGGIYNNASSPTLTDLSFLSNSAADGGGVYNIYGSSPNIKRCRFEGNSAAWAGGGIENIFSSSPVIKDCTFTNNTAGITGGGMVNHESAPRLDNCRFINNSATETGGGLRNSSSQPVLTNCIFSGNTASDNGGAIYNGDSSPTFTNCVIYGNTASENGGGVYNSGSLPMFTNSILWGDLPNEIYNLASTTTVNYSVIQGGYYGTGNINADPLFLDAANGNFHLWTGSPCIDSGYNYASYLPAFDFEGDARKLDGNGDGVVTVDMGVDEFQLPLIVTIDVKPGNSANVIRLSSKSPLPVAILTTGAFDASSVVPETVFFERVAAERWEMTDVDQDGDRDLLLYFEVAVLDLEAGDTLAILMGKTSTGISVMGTDMVKVIP